MYTHRDRAFGHALLEERIKVYGIDKLTDTDMESFAELNKTKCHRVIPSLHALDGGLTVHYEQMSKENGWGSKTSA